MEDSRLEAIVMAFMHQGRAPSEIDYLLTLRKGKSHDVVVQHWAADNEREEKDD